MRDAIMHLSFIYRSLRGETVCCVVHCVVSRAWRGGDRGHYASKYVERRDSVPVWCMVCTVLAAG